MGMSVDFFPLLSAVWVLDRCQGYDRAVLEWLPCKLIAQLGSRGQQLGHRATSCFTPPPRRAANVVSLNKMAAWAPLNKNSANALFGLSALAFGYFKNSFSRISFSVAFVAARLSVGCFSLTYLLAFQLASKRNKIFPLHFKLELACKRRRLPYAKFSAKSLILPSFILHHLAIYCIPVDFWCKLSYRNIWLDALKTLCERYILW